MRHARGRLRAFTMDLQQVCDRTVNATEIHVPINKFYRLTHGGFSYQRLHLLPQRRE